jgi:energy-coupling factor transporter ATP-binding protein EcfA2
LAVVEHTGPARVAVEQGQIVSILGAPGSGKTRLGLELGFLARPVEGEVLFHGKNPMQGRRSWAHRPREVTMLVQNAEDQLFARTVYDDVAFGPRHFFLPEEEIEDRVIRALQVVRLDVVEIRERSPFALSGGERRRVALAGVLAMEPEVLILDEPTSSLDPQTRDEFVDLLRPLRARTGVVWLTASAAEAAHADCVYLIERGKTTDIGRGETVLHRWRELYRAGIELPPLYTLAAEIESHGHTLPIDAMGAQLEAAIIESWRGAHAR